MERDGSTNSIWQTSTRTHRAQAVPPGSADVLIVGAGITGCSTALELARAGKKVVLIDARHAGFGTTGGTTAHLNTILDHHYHAIQNDHGADASRLLAKGLKAALTLVDRNVKELGIECDHARRNGILFSTTKKETELLEKIHAATREAGIEATFTDRVPLPRKAHRALLIPDQAQIHPLRYINALLHRFEELGGTIVNECRMLRYEEKDDLVVVSTSKGEVKAGKIILATHTPPGVNLLHFRCAPYRSYALAAKLKDADQYPDGLVYDMEDPYHYYRTQEMDGAKWLIAGGEDHKTGHEERTELPAARLEEHVRSVFNVDRITHQWSSQYYTTTDGLPYIGRLPGTTDHVLVATGFSGNGITLGCLSALIFTDQLTRGSSEYDKLFDPRRISPVAGFSEFVKENADVIGHMISKPFLAEKIEGLDEIKNDEARLVKYEGKQLGLYRDHHGQLHAVETICPHAKCTVKWNLAEKSWDCPCHGSRFSIDGAMLTGPSTHDLPQVRTGS